MAAANIPGQAPSGQPASGIWKALSSPAFDPGKFARVENVEFTRDRVHFKLEDGTIQFTQAVNGVVCAAVFHGNGRVTADPPNRIEAQQLQLFLKEPRMNLAFTEATFTFTDGLLEEVSRQVKWTAGGSSDDLYAKRQQAREDLGAAYLPRLFQSVMSGDTKRTAYFLADMKSKDGDWFEVIDDATQPEEIWVGRWTDVGPLKIPDVWMQFPAGGQNPRRAYEDPGARQSFLIPTYEIDATVGENADLDATAHVDVEPQFSGEQGLVFRLDSNLRVSSVKDSSGRPLEFFQPAEKEDRIQSYGDYIAVYLLQPTQAGQKTILDFHYAGKGAVRRLGDDNYFCQSFSWYPSAFTASLGVSARAFRSGFALTFHNPKHFGLVATGHKVSEATVGNTLVTTWKSDVPLTVAGFAFGRYKTYSQKPGNVEIQLYANEHLTDDLKRESMRLSEYPQGPSDPRDPRSFQGFQVMTGVASNITSPVEAAKGIGSVTASALALFEAYYGPYPYKQLAVANISGFSGPGWPGLLYLSYLYRLPVYDLPSKPSNKQQADPPDYSPVRETSRQWWGQRVTPKSHHDQWLSDGFAEFSRMLYVRSGTGSLKQFIERARLEKETLQAQDGHDHTVESLGPLWIGRRILSSQTSPSSYQTLMYSKGAFVLHMLNMQLFDARNPDPDHRFKEMMQDYCKTFDNKAASTEDFKAIVEKHMTAAMDLDGNHRMDWFFNQYVYGTGIPQYSLAYTLDATPDGQSHVKGELHRAGVPDTWKDVIPLYAHVGEKTLRIGALRSTHPTETFDFVLPMKAARLSIAEYEDLLAEVKQ